MADTALQPEFNEDDTQDFDFTVDDIEESVPTDLEEPEDYDDGSDPNFQG